MNFATHHPATARLARPSTRVPRERGLPAAVGVLRELCLYLAGSERSRIRQRERLGELDDRLLRDVGLDPRGTKRDNP
jgi:hypothetical protein